MPRLAVTGDAMLGRKVGQAIEVHGPGHVWGDTVPVFEAVDAALVNLECTVAESGDPDPSRTFNFRAPPAAVDALERVGTRVASLANNHALDFGDEALLETLDRLDAAGIEAPGAGEPGQAWAPARFRVDGVEVGVLATTDNVPEWDAERRQPGVAYAAAEPGRAGFEALEREVEGLAREVDLTVVSAHWGPNMVREPSPTRREAALRLAEAGADLVWGHSAHLFQGLEHHEGALVLHDAGDLVDDYRIDPDEHNEIGFVFLVEATARGLRGVELVPTRIDPRACQVNRADAGAAQFARSRMRELCEPFGTALEQTEAGGLRVPAPGPG